MSFLHLFRFFCLMILLMQSTQAGKLAIVIDDVGYRPIQEHQILKMPAAISVAVLPHAPHAREMATLAHQSGHEVLIHLPMAPLSKQPLEKDTLLPDMPASEIQRIISEAVERVPYATGLNNHMGSAMTSNLPAMQKVMQALSHYQLYFLDSMTIANSQSVRAAAGTQVKILKRRVFLDDSLNEADIRQQFQRAVQLAQRDGSAIAIGHPHPATVRVLQQLLPQLPANVVLVSPRALLNEISAPAPLHREQPQRGSREIVPGTCPVNVPHIPLSRFFSVMFGEIKQSKLCHYLHCDTWTTAASVPE
ncbi:MAG: putative protein [Candidatus Erwinia impunctatus]